MAISDAAGKILNVGDLVVYAVGTRSSDLSFGVILDIKEERNVESHTYNPAHAGARVYESIKARVKLELREPDGSLKKEYEYPNGYVGGPVWAGNYRRQKTNLTDIATIWSSDGDPNDPRFGLPFKIERYFKIDSITPEV